MKITITKEQAERIADVVAQYNAQERERRGRASGWGSLFRSLRAEWARRDSIVLLGACAPDSANRLILSCAAWFRQTPTGEPALSSREILASVLDDAEVEVDAADFFKALASYSAIEMEIQK